ncbi:GGDEF domain-containing protein [Filobacillus milosensis]|uniref:GGDEF domain-containing protein n=1 Tax=Filobacillus milosensis TaxID=94137 RepID=A0A4Y8ISL9_9BACI|nr:sensor domain-containing diguanylate cyclase [Filobacillus milosensis]TFB24938.1 GGDEF domain-containing protein [Filobacillus milosensis]
MARSKVITVWLIWLLVFPATMVYLYLEFSPDLTEHWVDLLAFAIVISAVAIFPVKVGTITVLFVNGISLAAFLYFGLFVEVVLSQIMFIPMFVVTKLKKDEAYRIATNSTMFIIVSLASAGVYYALGGTHGELMFNSFEQIVPIVGYILTSILVNQFCLSVFQTYLNGQKFFAFPKSLLIDTGLNLLVFPLGIVLYLMYVQIEAVAVFLVGIPFILLSIVFSYYHKTQRINKFLHTTSEIGHELSKSLNVKSVLDTFLSEIEKLIPTSHIYVFDITTESNSMSLIRYMDHQGTQIKKDYKLYRGEGFAGKVYDEEKSIMLTRKKDINDLYNHELAAGVNCVIGVPILRNNKIVGVLSVASHEINAYEKYHLMLLEILANFLSVAIENARHYEAAKTRMQRDQLTNLYNYRYFIEYLDGYASDLEAKGLSEILSVIILDLDSFKAINDNYGHESGNEVLTELSKRLVDYFGQYGIIARYGGEEFTILVKNMPHEEVVQLAEDIREAIAKEPFVLYKHINGNVEVQEINVTASIGVATYPNQCESPQELIRNADRSMYVGAKRNGKNKVASLSV